MIFSLLACLIVMMSKFTTFHDLAQTKSEYANLYTIISATFALLMAVVRVNETVLETALRRSLDERYKAISSS